jgi:hypothetical protein
VSVPRFYFDTQEGATFTPDDEGLEFANLDVAERAAALAAAEMGRDYLPKGGDRDLTIEIRNEHRKRVLTVTVAMTIERHDPYSVRSNP